MDILKPDQTDFIASLRKAIKEVLAEKEEASRLDKVEDMLSAADATISQLSEAIVAKEEGLTAASTTSDALKTQIDALQAKIVDLEVKLTQANEDTEKEKERATTAENALFTIEAERKLGVREAELAAAKVIKAEDKRVAQLDKVRAMTDEEFASYKQELIDVRSEVEAELKREIEVASAEEEVGEVTVPPADLDKVLHETAEAKAAAAAATLNVEVVTENMRTDYFEMAKLMADNIAAGRQ